MVVLPAPEGAENITSLPFGFILVVVVVRVIKVVPGCGYNNFNHYNICNPSNYSL